VRRVDLWIAQVHQPVAEILRDLDGPVEAETLGLIRGAFVAGGVRGDTRERLAGAISRLSRDDGPREWVHSRRGPEMAAAELMSAVGPRSGRYVFVVKQLLGTPNDPAMVLDLVARGRDVPARVVTEYLLELLGHSRRTVGRVMDVL
jgi:hypothetical protein